MDKKFEILSDECPWDRKITPIEIPVSLETPMKPRRVNAYQASEYVSDSLPLLVKTIIKNLLMVIEDIDDKVSSQSLMDVLKNTIILHGKTIALMPEFIIYIENALMGQELVYNIFIIYKMLKNLKDKQVSQNIHFRVINDKVSSLPPISTEQRIIIENNITRMRFSRQIKKRVCMFKVGQIVGARDKNNNWWLSEVIHIHDDPNYAGYWFYIRFKGWDLNGDKSMHNEWISSESFRIKFYNPRKHFLKR